MQTYYDILGVKPKDSQEKIKDVYLEKIKKYHPDLYEGDKVFAEQMTARINEAYNTLKDAEKRKEYDEITFSKNKIKKENKIKKNKFKLFFKNIFSGIKSFFVKIKNCFKRFKTNKESMTEEQKLRFEKRRLNLIIIIDTIIIFILLILLFIL